MSRKRFLNILVICLCSRRFWPIPEFSGFSRDEKVQKLTARLISSELNAHQMSPGGVPPHWRSRPALELMDGISLSSTYTSPSGFGNPTLEESYLGKEEGRRPEDRSLTKGADSELPGWQHKETASQLPKQGRLLNQRHSFDTPRSFGVGTPSGQAR